MDVKLLGKPGKKKPCKTTDQKNIQIHLRISINCNKKKFPNLVCKKKVFGKFIRPKILVTLVRRIYIIIYSFCNCKKLKIIFYRVFYSVNKE